MWGMFVAGLLFSAVPLGLSIAFGILAVRHFRETRAERGVPEAESPTLASAGGSK